MRNRLLLIAVFSLFLKSTTDAQVVTLGGYIQGFLQGAWLEIGVSRNAAFGTTACPAGYHSHLYTGSPATGNLAEVYDYGHDGWTVGAPIYMGDYTYPGSPFEGWEIQMNGVRSQQYASPAYSGTPYNYSGAATMTPAGTPMTYSNSGGVMKVTWNGNFTGGGATLAINQETRVDTLPDAVVVTVKMYNTSGTAANGVYYWRSCDPDNDESWPGGGFYTDNYIEYQNGTVPNPTHKVEVTGIGQSATRPPITLCTKDCRAVATIYGSWGLTVTQDLAAVWNQTYGGGGAFYNVGVNHPGDIAIGLVYNIGTIAPGDSAAISYAYVFNGPTGIDDAGALPDPELVVNNVVVSAFPDTFDMCTLPPGIDTVPVNILYGDDKDWTWSKWTWSPGTGLSATSGTNVVVNGNLLPGPVTYTVTGTDSSTGMYSCNTRQFVFTIAPCKATPYFYDSLRRGCLFDTVYFFNQSLNTTYWSWDFGDGSPHDTGYYADSSHWNTMHIYPANTQWNVILMAGNFRGPYYTNPTPVDLRQDVNAEFQALPDTICFEPGVAMHFMNMATADTGDFYGGSGLIPYIPGRYLWNFQDTGISTQSDPDYAFSRPGIFKVRQIVWDAISCPDTVEHQVFVVQNSIRMVDDTSFCYAIPTPLFNIVTTVPFTPDANAYSYSWTQSPDNLDNTTVQFPNVITTGVFTDILTVTIPNIGPDGCPVVDSVKIHSYEPKKIQNISVSVTIPFGNSIQLNASNMVYYYWTPNDGSLDDPNISNPIATPQQTTTYRVRGLDEHGCPDSTVVTVVVDTSMTQQIPSAFTPNGDGINDVFRPVGIQFQRLLEFRVFNRWGQEIFYTNNREVGWDGTFHGDKQDAGVYSYLIVVARPGQENAVYKGNVTLLR